MPTSDFSTIPEVLRRVIRADPKSILDIGVGFGKWGMLFREYLELYGHSDENRISPDAWERRIDGVEIFPKYIGPWQESIYDSIFMVDIRNFDRIGDYDLVFMGDVIEHLPREDGVALLSRIKTRVIVVTTEDTPARPPIFGNSHEAHISSWSRQDFPGFLVDVVGGKIIAERGCP